jgi:chemotaxis signal transduction protein
MTAERTSLVPSFVVFQVGSRRVALPRDAVAELIASPVLFTFPHTTPLVTGVALRRGRILPVLDLGPAVMGAASTDARFFLVVERRIENRSERCAIPVHGECELVTGIMMPVEGAEEFVNGALDLNGERIDVLDIEKAIAAGARSNEAGVAAEEALP